MIPRMIQTPHDMKGDFPFRVETSLTFIIWSTFFMVVSSLDFKPGAPGFLKFSMQTSVCVFVCPPPPINN